MLEPWNDDRLTANGRAVCENFADWFDGSKVVDVNGLPLPMYRGEHGATEEGDLQTKLGSYAFVEEASIASTYATVPNDHRDKPQNSRVIKAYLAIKNPIFVNKDDPFLELSWLVDKLGHDEALRIARKFADDIEYTGNWMDDEDGNFTGYDTVQQFLDDRPDRIDLLYFNAYRYLDDPEEIAKLRTMGFDGAGHIGNGESAGEMEYRVFDKSQAKSVFNRGLYLKNNPSLTDQGADLSLLYAHQAIVAIEEAIKTSAPKVASC